MPFGSLWIPGIVSAVVVFVGSSILHMVLKYHRADVRPLPNEDSVRDVLGKGKPAPGLYITPYCAEMKQMGQPAMKARFDQGPVALITVIRNGLPNMPKLLAQWFLFSLLVSFVTAYVARHTLQPGAEGMQVLRITGTVAFAAYGLSHVSDSIWKGQPWANTARALFDGLVYALLTALTFRALWPSV